MSVGKPKGKRPLEKPRGRWEYNIKMDLKKWDGVLRTGFISLRLGPGEGLL
jgi:hypothetical protein